MTQRNFWTLSQRFATIYSNSRRQKGISYGTLWLFSFYFDPTNANQNLDFRCYLLSKNFLFKTVRGTQKILEVREILSVEWIAKCLFKSFNTVAVFFTIQILLSLLKERKIQINSARKEFFLIFVAQPSFNLIRFRRLRNKTTTKKKSFQGATCIKL